MLTAMSLLPLASPAQAINRLDIESRIAKLRTSVDSLATAISDAETRLDRAQDSIDRHSRALATADRRLAVLGDAQARRSAEMYIVGGMGVLETLATSESVDVFADRLGYLEQIRSSEVGALESLVALKRRAGREATELGKARDDAAQALRTLESKRRALDDKLREYQSLLALAKLAGRVTSRASRGRIPGFRCPVAGPHGIANNYGDRRRGGPHQGVDMPADSGTPVVAVLPSRVVDVVRGGWMGRGIIVRDAGGNEWWYAHLSKTYVSDGEALAAGETIGRVGCSGHCTGPHLHFEYHPGGGSARNPYRILRSAC